MADGDSLSYFFDLLSFKRLVTNLNIMGCIIYIWDYILMFSMEVDLVWRSKWNFMKGLYLFQRYMPFIDITICLHFATGGDLTRTACRSSAFSIAMTTSVGSAASEVILTLRTWAVWNRNQRLAIILAIFFALVQGLILTTMGIYLNSFEFSDPPYPGVTGCFRTSSHRYDLVFLAVLAIAWDSLMLILVLIPAVRAFRFRGNSDLVNNVYRDGVIYYLYTFVISIINVLIFAILPPRRYRVLLMTARLLRSILASRALLDIRAQTGDKLVRSDGLTELNTDHLFSGNAQSSRLESIRFATTRGRLSS